MTTHKNLHKRISVTVRIVPTLHKQVKDYERKNCCKDFTQAIEEVLHFGLQKVHEIDAKSRSKIDEVDNSAINFENQLYDHGLQNRS